MKFFECFNKDRVDVTMTLTDVVNALIQHHRQRAVLSHAQTFIVRQARLFYVNIGKIFDPIDNLHGLESQPACVSITEEGNGFAESQDFDLLGTNDVSD